MDTKNCCHYVRILKYAGYHNFYAESTEKRQVKSLCFKSSALTTLFGTHLLQKNQYFLSVLAMNLLIFLL